MIRRIEFTLDMDDPLDAAIYKALSGDSKRRRAASTIRQALAAYLLGGSKSSPVRPPLPVEAPQPETAISDDAAERLMDQTASMFGF
jgi:hypothetical protein